MSRLNLVSMTAVFVLAISLAAVSSSHGQSVSGGEKQSKESIVSASGTARVSRAPDYVDVLVGVVMHETTAGESQRGAEKVMSAAVAAIKALSLEGSELQTGTVDLQPRYERRDYGTEVYKIIGYSATMTLRVRTSDVKSVAKVIDAALTAGCNKLDGVQFGIKEALEAREESIRLATKAAKRKAEVLAESLGLKLGRVVNVSTTSNQWGGWYGANRMSQMSNSVQEGGGGAGQGEDAVVPGKVEVWSDTNVTFELVEK